MTNPWEDLGLTVVHSFDCSFEGCSEGGYPMAGLIMDSAGNLYGMTSQTVFKINPTTGKETVLDSFAGDAPYGTPIFPQGQLLIDSAGNLSGTTNAGGVDDIGMVFKID